MSRDESRRSKRCRVDRDYDLGLTANIMVNSYDDERTLDEEEALEASEDTHNELDNLQKESNMPLKELLSMYNYSNIPNMDPNEDDDDEDDEEEEDDEDEDDEDDQQTYEPDLKQFYTEMVKAEENGVNNQRSSATAKSGDMPLNTDDAAVVPNVDKESDGTHEPKIEQRGPGPIGDTLSSLNDISGLDHINSVPSTGGGSSARLLRSVSRPQSEEEEDDCDYSPDEDDWKKTIMVGSDYQAVIPEGLCKYDDALPYENEDKLLWDPFHITEEEIDEFLKRAQPPPAKGTLLPCGSHVRDDEQALYLLLQCGYNVEEALRRRRMNVLPSNESVSLWSEEECHNFETGLKNYGKDFHLIQKHKVRTRSVGELVQFYYLWKKTERHDIFAAKTRVEKKRYTLHPGVTDYMDRFLEEQEGVRDRSSSPNVNYLLSGDIKRQRLNNSSTNIEDQVTGKSNVDNWDTNTVTSAASKTTALNQSTVSASTTTTTSSSSDSSVNNAAPVEIVPSINLEPKNSCSATTAVGPTGDQQIQKRNHILNQQQSPDHKQLTADVVSRCEVEQQAVAANLSTSHTPTDIVRPHLPS